MACGVIPPFGLAFCAPVVVLLSLPPAVALSGIVRVVLGRGKGITEVVASTMLAWFSGNLVLAPAVNEFKSSRRFPLESKAWIGKTSNLFPFGVFNLYLRQERIPVIKKEEELREELASPDTYIIGKWRKFRRVLSSQEIERYMIHRGRVAGCTFLLLGGGRSAEKR